MLRYVVRRLIQLLGIIFVISVGSFYLIHLLPGNPAVVVENMPGAGSGKAAGTIYSMAPKDGTAIGIFAPGIIAEPLLGHGDGATK